MCDSFNYDYGSECKGFRGCGKCFCPTCDEYDDGCESMGCTTHDGTSNGCVISKRNCRESESTNCLKYSCSEGQCIETEKCASVAEQYQYECQEVSCNPDNGECPVVFNDNKCKVLHKGDCGVWECYNPEKHSSDDLDTVDGKGCVKVIDMITECKKNNTPCMTFTCDPDTLSCVSEDTCKKDNNACHTYTCTGEGSSAHCEDTETPRPSDLPADDKCTKYKCDNSKGWVKDEENSWNAEKCRNNITAEERTCQIFSCDPSQGCQHVKDDTCDAACVAVEENCWKTASKTVEVCETAKCVGDSEDTVECRHEAINCTESPEAQLAEDNNKLYKDRCYTYQCSYGACEMIELLPRHETTKCTEWKCVGNKKDGWSWTSDPTDEYNNCHNDACYERTCDDNLGCVPVKEICESQSNMCYSYKCENNNQTCNKTSLLKEYDCMIERCATDGTTYPDWTWKTLEEACPNGHNCTVASCPQSKLDPNYGRCVYTLKKHEDDPCTDFTCNTSDDDSDDPWIRSPHCNDGYACTEDKCSVDGDCWTVDIDCYQEINMTDYPCFRASCKEDSTVEKGYRCVRKLKNGAYIDVCGRCIREGDAGSSEDTNEEKDALKCTLAPEEPMIKEGIAAASVAMIVLGAVIIGGAIATTGVIGTKTLLERARAANNQSAHSNPLFEDNAAEMNNPTFSGF